MSKFESDDIKAWCQDANLIAARLRGVHFKPAHRSARGAVPRTPHQPPEIKPQKRKWEVTDAQQRVLDFMREFLSRNDEMPPYWLICKQFGWSSVGSAAKQVNSLAQKGLLERNELGHWRLVREVGAA